MCVCAPRQHRAGSESAVGGLAALLALTGRPAQPCMPTIQMKKCPGEVKELTEVTQLLGGGTETWKAPIRASAVLHSTPVGRGGVGL